MSRLGADRGRFDCVLVQSKADRRQRHLNNAIVGKNLPGRLAVDVRLDEGVGHDVGGMCVGVEGMRSGLAVRWRWVEWVVVQEEVVTERCFASAWKWLSRTTRCILRFEALAAVGQRQSAGGRAGG